VVELVDTLDLGSSASRLKSCLTDHLCINHYLDLSPIISIFVANLLTMSSIMRICSCLPLDS